MVVEGGKDMSTKIAKTFRIILLAPVVASIMLAIIQICKPQIFVSTTQLWISVVCLVVFPVIAYPVSYVIPKIRQGGRNAQRNLAICFAFIGYVVGLVFTLVLPSSMEQKIMFLTYLISAVLIALFSFVFKIKASGHMCGVAGPIAYVTLFISPWALVAVGLLLIVYHSSIKLKRHTPSQLFLGTIFPVIALFVSCSIIFARVGFAV